MQALHCRYQLSDEKTFGSLFHPQKASLLRLVDHFLHKTGCVLPSFCVMCSFDP